jgi:hypothetical protein
MCMPTPPNAIEATSLEPLPDSKCLNGQAGLDRMVLNPRKRVSRSPAKDPANNPRKKDGQFYRS